MITRFVSAAFAAILALSAAEAQAVDITDPENTIIINVDSGDIVIQLLPDVAPQHADPAWDLGQTIVDRYDSTVDHDDYTQAGNLYRMFDDDHRDRLTGRIAGVLGQARKEVQLRQLCHFFRADEDYGKRVAQKLGIDLDQVMKEMGAAAAGA